MKQDHKAEICRCLFGFLPSRGWKTLACTIIPVFLSLISLCNGLEALYFHVKG